jgi:hypothetical protein
MNHIPLSSFNIPAQRFIDWINLIRQTEESSLRYEFLEAFWESQLISKYWMVDGLKKTINKTSEAKKILPNSFGYVFGGWHGLSAMMLVDNIPEFSLIYSIDKDSKNELNGKKLSTYDKRIAFQTYDMKDFSLRAYNPINTALVVNTSTEHISQEEFNQWIKNVPPRTWVVLQGNNFEEVEEHIRPAKNLEHFMQMNPLDAVWYSGELDCKQFTRYMVIGYNMEKYDGLTADESNNLYKKIEHMLTRTSYEL